MINTRQSFVVKPQEPTPNVDMCVADSDQDKPISHAPTVYFYAPSQSRHLSFTSASQILRDALSRVLVHFYPLAGRLHLIPGGGGRVTLKCNSAGAIFYEAESSATIHDFKDFAPTPELRSLIPSVDYSNSILQETPIVMVQLTQLGCGGICMGLAISHTMVDGFSASHFVSEWARSARGEPLETPPFLDRTMLLGADPPAPPRFQHKRFDPAPLVIGQPDNREERNKETTVLMLHLSKAQVQKLTEMANESRAQNIKAYSRFETMAAHMWRSACKARGHVPEQPTRVCFPVSLRTKISLPKGYFGNALFRETVLARAGELLEGPLGYVCGKIRETVEMVTEEYVKSALDDIKRQPDLSPFRTFHTVGHTQGLFNGNPNMDITSWLGIPLQGVDFGWGKDIYMGPGTLYCDGKCFIFSGRDEDGSITIALRFQVAHADNLLSFFYEHLC